MPVNFCYTQKVCGFQQENIKSSKGSAEISLKRTKPQCPYCGSLADYGENGRIQQQAQVADKAGVWLQRS